MNEHEATARTLTVILSAYATALFGVGYYPVIASAAGCFLGAFYGPMPPVQAGWRGTAQAIAWFFVSTLVGAWLGAAGFALAAGWGVLPVDSTAALMIVCAACGTAPMPLLSEVTKLWRNNVRRANRQGEGET